MFSLKSVDKIGGRRPFLNLYIKISTVNTYSSGSLRIFKDLNDDFVLSLPRRLFMILIDRFCILKISQSVDSDAFPQIIRQ